MLDSLPMFMPAETLLHQVEQRGSGQVTARPSPLFTPPGFANLFYGYPSIHHNSALHLGEPLRITHHCCPGSCSLSSLMSSSTSCTGQPAFSRHARIATLDRSCRLRTASIFMPMTWATS